MEDISCHEKSSSPSNSRSCNRPEPGDRAESVRTCARAGDPRGDDSPGFRRWRNKNLRPRASSRLLSECLQRRLPSVRRLRRRLPDEPHCGNTDSVGRGALSGHSNPASAALEHRSARPIDPTSRQAPARLGAPRRGRSHDDSSCRMCAFRARATAWTERPVEKALPAPAYMIALRQSPIAVEHARKR